MSGYGLAPALALVAMALLVGSGRPMTPRSGRRGRDATGGGAREPRARSPVAGPVGVAVAVAGVVVAGVALLGPSAGLMAGAVGGPAAGLGVRWLQRRPVRGPADRSLAVTLDLAAAALRSGRPLADALLLAVPAARTEPAEQLRRVAGLARLGADAEQAWAAIPRDSPLGEVAGAAVRSATSGMKLAAAFERLAVEIRAEQGAAATARAHRAGVRAMGPLAACFLPSFVCLGVVPTVVGIARSAFGPLP